MGANFFRLLVASILLSAIAAAVNSPALSTRATAAVAGQPKARADARSLHNTMRTLWGNQVDLTRLFIAGALGDLPDAEDNAERLLQNQKDMGDAIKPFYGNAAGEELTQLLRQHVLIATDILVAAENGNQPAALDAVTRWYSNTDEIAKFLSTLNPENWPKVKVTAMLREHLGLTLTEIRAQLTDDYAGSTSAYEEAQLQAIEIADLISSGIIRQFPDRFRSR